MECVLGHIENQYIFFQTRSSHKKYIVLIRRRGILFLKAVFLLNHFAQFQLLVLEEHFQFINLFNSAVRALWTVLS